LAFRHPWFRSYSRLGRDVTANHKMNTLRLAGLLSLAAILFPLHAESVSGRIVITKKLTRRRVTAPVPLYDRGPAVGLGTDTEDDPLAFERSRVVVYLEGRAPGSPHSAGSQPVARIDQQKRRFSPETLIVEAGSKVSFPNFDPIFHNVFSLSHAKTFDLGNYPMGETRVVTFPEPGIVYVNCHLHSNMSATIVVAPNRWNAKADRDGAFELPDVPPGRYTIVAWHKAAGFFRQQITVTQGQGAHVQFLIPIHYDNKNDPETLSRTAAK
jgi:plastocyanin